MPYVQAIAALDFSVGIALTLQPRERVARRRLSREASPAAIPAPRATENRLLELARGGDLYSAARSIISTIRMVTCPGFSRTPELGR